MRCVEKGVYFGYYGVNQEVLRIAPPLTITDEDVEIIVSTIREVATELRGGLLPKATVEKAHQFAIGLVMYKQEQ